ncbi:MAG: hypothetical protein ACRDIX_07315 [Actinomycetota bacterium]
MNVLLDLALLAVVVFIGRLIYLNDVKPYKGVRRCDCHPRRPRGERFLLHLKGPPWRA